MKFGHEYEQALASEGFPQEWLGSAVDYKYLKKCIKKVNRELKELGLGAGTINQLSGPLEHEAENGSHVGDDAQADNVPGFVPQLRVLVDRATGVPLDASLTPETRANLQKLARHESVLAERQAHLGLPREVYELSDEELELVKTRTNSTTPDVRDTKWVQIPLASAKGFFDLLAPKLEELEQLREAEMHKLEVDILDLGDAVENVVEPIMDGFEAKRKVSYRDLYFWREMFRLYLETPIFYSNAESNSGALTFSEAKSRLYAYDQKLRSTGLLAKMKTPAARQAAKQFFDLNVDILKIIGFQEMNARAMRKILKKFDKRTHLEGQLFLNDLRAKYPALLPASQTGKLAFSNKGFANSIARDLQAEIASKVLGIVPQIDDWSCPVCLTMAWRPVSLGCCRALYCIRCVIKLQDEGHVRCPTCNAETVKAADGRNIDFEAMDFLEKYFPLETKKRQKENETASLARQYGEEFVKPGCEMM